MKGEGKLVLALVAFSLVAIGCFRTGKYYGRSEAVDGNSRPQRIHHVLPSSGEWKSGEITKIGLLYLYLKPDRKPNEDDKWNEVVPYETIRYDDQYLEKDFYIGQHIKYKRNGDKTEIYKLRK